MQHDAQAEVLESPKHERAQVPHRERHGLSGAGERRRGETVQLVPGVISVETFAPPTTQELDEEDKTTQRAKLDLASFQEEKRRVDASFQAEWGDVIGNRLYMDDAGRAVPREQLTETEQVRLGLLRPVFEKKLLGLKTKFKGYEDALVVSEERRQAFEMADKEYKAIALALNNKIATSLGEIRRQEEKREFRRTLVPEFYSADRQANRQELVTEFQTYFGGQLQFAKDEVVAVKGDGGSYLREDGNGLVYGFGMTEADRALVQSSSANGVGGGPARQIQNFQLPWTRRNADGSETRFLYVHKGRLSQTNYGPQSMTTPKLKARVTLKNGIVITKELL